MVNVGTVASRVVMTAPRTMSVVAAARLMREHHVGTLVVVTDSEGLVKPSGVVTDRDLVMEVLAQNVNPDLITIGDLPGRPAVTVREDVALLDAIQTMNRNGIRRLVVVDARGGLVGLLSMDDIIGVLAEELSGISQAIDTEQRGERTQRRTPATVE